MQMPKSKYEQTKQNDEPRVKEVLSVQDVCSVVSIDESGIFELPDKRFSKLYTLILLCIYFWKCQDMCSRKIP